MSSTTSNPTTSQGLPSPAPSGEDRPSGLLLGTTNPGNETTSSGSSFATLEMQSVANKIQDRYQERTLAQLACQQADQEHQKMKQSLHSVRQAHTNTRVAYLEVVQTTQELELEFHRFQQGEHSKKMETATLLEQNCRLEKEHRQLEDSWSIENDVMARAVVQREEYLHLIDGAVQRLDDIQRIRERKLQCLKNLCATALEQSPCMAHETEQLQREVQELEEEDVRCQAEIQRSSDQVRRQLAKVRCPVENKFVRMHKTNLFFRVAMDFFSSAPHCARRYATPRIHIKKSRTMPIFTNVRHWTMATWSKSW